MNFKFHHLLVIFFFSFHFSNFQLFGQYCASNATSTFDSNVDEVIINGVPVLLNNTAGQCATYSDFTTLSTNLTIGSPYSVDVTPGTCGGNYTKHTKVYIDYNQDLDFNDPGEELGGGGPIVAPGQVSIPFTVPVTALPGATTLRVVVEETGNLGNVNPCGTFTWGETEDYTVMIMSGGDDDIGVANIDNPVQVCGLGSEQVTISVINGGINSASGFSVEYYIVDPILGLQPTVSESYLGTINPGQSAQHVFTPIYDFSAIGSYEIVAFVSYGPDTFPLNDTLSVTLNNNSNGTPFIEDFETFGAGSPGSLANGWTVSAAGSYEWYVEDATGGNENSSGTGPWFDHTLAPASGGMYMYTEASSGSQGDITELKSPCLNLSGVVCPKASFWYHMHGADMGELHVDLEVGGTIIQDIIPPLIGEQQPNQSDDYVNAIIPLSPYIGQALHVIFRGVRGSGYQSDMSIDDFEIIDQNNVDVAIGAITYPNDGCNFSSTENIEVEILNNSCNPISNIPVTFIVNGPSNSGPFTETYFGSIPAGGTAPFTFSGSANFTQAGIYNITVYTGLPGDASPNNDTLSYSLSFLGGGHLEDFETFIVGTPGQFLNGWTTTATGNFQWYVEDATGANENSTGTGPFYDHTLSPSSGGIYLYTEASSGGQGDEAELISPCININGMGCPTASFWYHMHGADMGDLHFDLDTGAGIIQDIVPPLIGQQQTNQSDEWIQMVVDLSPYVNNSLHFIFRGERGSSYTSDMSIDDFKVEDNSLINTGVLSMSSPTSGCTLGANESVSVVIDNPSCFSQANIPIEITITGPVNSGPTVEYLSNSIPSYSTSPFTFSSPYDFSIPGIYQIQIVTLLSSDTLTDNDTLIETVYHTGEGYFEDFEKFVAGSPGTFFNGWTASSTGSFEWYVEDANGNDENSTGTGPTLDHTLYPNTGGIYLYTEASSGSQGDEAYLISPCIDLAGVTCPVAQVYLHMVGGDIGELHFDVQTASGFVLDVIPPIIGQQSTAPSDTFFSHLVDLTGFNGQNINVRFRAIHGGSYQGDISLDDFLIMDEGIKELEIIDFTQIASGCSPGSEVSITATITNNGCGKMADFNLILDTDGQINNGPFVETITDSLAAGDTITVTFSNTIDLSESGSYSINLEGVASLDVNPTNNSQTDNITIIASPTADAGESDTVCPNFPTLLSGNPTSSGGSPPYTYLWSGTSQISNPSSPIAEIFPSESVSIVLAVTDSNGCVDRDTLEIVVFNSDFTLGPDLEKCKGDTIVLDAGPQFPNYLWSTGEISQTITLYDNLTQGFIEILVGDSNGCDLRDSVHYSFNPNPTVELGPDTTYCSSNPVLLDAGTGGLNYSWSNGSVTPFIFVNQGGSYGVTVESEYGCTTTDEVNLTILAPMYVDLGPDTLTCGDPITLTATAPGTYLWNTGETTPSIQVNNPGNYSVTVSNPAGCDALDTVAIFYLPATAPSFDANTNLCPTIIFSANAIGAIPDTWSWDFGDGNTVLDQQNITHSFGATGVYSVTLTTTNECGPVSVSQDVDVSCEVGVSDELEKSLRVFPNPNNGEFDLVFEGTKNESGELKVFNLQGKLIESIFLPLIFSGIPQKIKLKDHPKGVYLLKIRLDGKNYLQKISLF